eukprot:CAMPEP_0183468344 /NCGR_PEP_ID=MMETSP0370-20130417/152594_1 /TAXON_ID=268820 /ORGANISM="Peridinium aciculiferum, Strain PAER-2" /LENGTH=68 /DNA_ID=CAMNT_0025660735 /DNA_START=135 /DNA_END=337 /DNA_ORIENTATION=+
MTPNAATASSLVSGAAAKVAQLCATSSISATFCEISVCNSATVVPAMARICLSVNASTGGGGSAKTAS